MITFPSLMRMVFLCLFAVQASAANIVIQNDDEAGEGFNDPNPPSNASQKGNNPGTSLGQLRLNVFESAAEVWGNLLASNMTITVTAKFDELFCSENSGTLGSAGATASNANFPGGQAGTAYPIALAEALANSNFNNASAEIRATFNSVVDTDPNCLGGNGFYYGLDGNVPIGMSNLFTTVLHELGHGLGFASISDVAPEGTGDFTGAGGFPDAFSRNLHDVDSGKSWDAMTSNERKASAVSEPALVWKGSNVTAQRTMHLGAATILDINAPGSIAGTFEALLGAEPTIQIPAQGVTADVVDGNSFGDGCSQINEATFTGKIVLFDATDSCTAAFPAFFSEFITNAVGVIIADTTGSGLPDMSGQISNQEITIPYVGVTKAVADSLRANIATANVTIGLSDTLLNGENQGMVKMYAPSEYEPSASASHWSKSASPDLLMEPILEMLNHADVDLTRAAFQDMGWGVEQADFFINAGLNDAWVSDNAPFQGLFFTVYPDLGFFFLSWFTFDSEQPGGGITAEFGAPDTRWVTGGAYYSGDSVTVSVELTSGGIFNGSNPVAGQVLGYGTITIVFNNCNEATLNYSFPSLGLSGQITLTRALPDNVSLCESIIAQGPPSVAQKASKTSALSLEPAVPAAIGLPGAALPGEGAISAQANQVNPQINAGMNDAWVSSGAPFQGLFFTVYPDLEFFFLSWFTFDSDPPGGPDTAEFGAHDQRWVTGGAFYSGNSVTLNVELTSGGIFNGSNPEAGQVLGYGTITIVFNTCNEATMIYNFPSVGLSGQVTLTRALPDNIALCDSLSGG